MSSSDREAAARRAESLRAEIGRHDYLYYSQDAPEISDSAYDTLLRELKKIEASGVDRDPGHTACLERHLRPGVLEERVAVAQRHQVVVLDVADGSIITNTIMPQAL